MTEAPLSPRERRLTEKLKKLQALLEEPIQTIEAIRRGEVDAFVVSETDESERVFVLRSADRLSRQIVESMGEGAVTLTQDGAIGYCNPCFETLIGKGRDDLLGTPFRNLVAEETREAFEGLLLQSDANAHGEISLRTSSGVIPVALASTLLAEADGSHHCVVVTDLREQRAREQLRIARDSAEQANRAKDEFLAMVSHELRSPITVILGWTRMLQMSRLDDETTSLAVQGIHHSTSRLLKLVDDILDASRLSAGRVVLQREVHDLRDSVRASLESVRFEVEQKPLEVECRIPEDPVLISGDPGRLQQVIVNLLANAAKFTPSRGRIELTLEASDGTAKLLVRDSGEGIDADFLPFVFDRFRQDDGSTTRAHRGLGLGLAIVKQLVEAHDGSVSAASEGKGKGAAFTVTLPLATGVPQEAPAPDQEPLPSLAGRRVLLVDDDDATVEVMRTILESAGAAVRTSMTSSQALAFAADFAPHVIVCDIAMPGEDGFDFLRQLQSTQKRVPVLAITGKSSASDRDAVLAAGFETYIRKPVEPGDLIRAISAFAH